MVDIPEVKAGTWRFRQLFVNGEPPTADEAAEAGGVPHRISARLHRRLSPESDQAVRLCPGQHRARPGAICGTWKSSGSRGGWTTGCRSRASTRNRAPSPSTARACLPSPSGTAPGPYWVENVFEALDTPGQWYLDRPQGMLYYLPRPGEEMRSAEIIAPRLSQVVRVVGRSGAPVHDLRFEGLSLRTHGVAAAGRLCLVAPGRNRSARRAAV